MRHPLGLGRDPTHVFQGSSRFPSPRSCLHHKSLIYQKTGESSAFRMHFLLFSLQWKCHLSKASCYHAFPMPNTWPPRRGFYLYISSDLYFSFKELHALRHPKCSQHKEVRLHETPPNRTKKKQGRETAPLPTAATVPDNPRPFAGVTRLPRWDPCAQRSSTVAGTAWHSTARHSCPTPAKRPDAATRWHLGPGKAAAVCVWRRIPTPSTEGDKRRRAGGGEGGLS